MPNLDKPALTLPRFVRLREIRRTSVFCHKSKIFYHKCLSTCNISTRLYQTTDIIPYVRVNGAVSLPKSGQTFVEVHFKDTLRLFSLDLFTVDGVCSKRQACRLVMKILAANCTRRYLNKIAL